MIYQRDLEGNAVPHEYVVGGHERFETKVEIVHDHDEVKPGETCPTCNRRVNHPKKASSPSSKVFGYRVPIDDAETHGEILDAAAEALGILPEPHHRFKLALYGAMLILQGARLEETGG